jgi:yeast amino acid transporter
MYDESDDPENGGVKHPTTDVHPAFWRPSSNDHGHENTDLVTTNEQRDLSRGLHQRHISLIAIAGAIGTGLFLGLGGAIQTAGPAGALLGYATIGLIVCAVQFALGEVTALLPVTGSFVRHAEFLVDPAMGFAIGWNIVCTSHQSAGLQGC